MRRKRQNNALCVPGKKSYRFEAKSQYFDKITGKFCFYTTGGKAVEEYKTKLIEKEKEVRALQIENKNQLENATDAASEIDGQTERAA